MDKTIVHQASTLFYRVGSPDSTHFAPAPEPSPTETAPAASNTAATPVILIHGFAEDGSIWDHQIASLKKNYPLIIPDLPGSGNSASVTGDTTVEQLADAIKAILDAESIQKCVMIGHSLGGYITLAFAQLYPERLKAIGLFHSTAYSDSEEKKEFRTRSIEFIRKNGAAPFIRQSTPNLFSETSRKEHSGWVTALTDRYIDSNPVILIQYYEAMIKRPDRTAVLAAFEGPVLFIIGGQDHVVPLEHSLRQSHMPALSYIHILENAGHAGMLEDSEGSNKALHHFLRFTSQYPFPPSP